MRLRRGGLTSSEAVARDGVQNRQVVTTLEFTSTARRVGVASAVGYVVLSVVYTATLAVGLSSLPSAHEPIGDPLFTILELLILLMMPLLVAVMVALYAWTPVEHKFWSLLALVFTSMLAALTCSVHFVILAMSRHPEVIAQPSSLLLFSFTWPSVVYALDILAWDVFFALAALSTTPVFAGDRLRTSIRVVMGISGISALAGLFGVMLEDMQVRNIGILGYAVVFPAGVLLLALLLHRTIPRAPVAR